MYADVLVVGHTPRAAQVAAGLRARGATATTWFLPLHCTPDTAAVLATTTAGSGQTGLVAPAPAVVLSLWAFQVVHDAVFPCLLPSLEAGTVWLHLGPSSRRRASSREAAAQRRGVTLVHAPLAWTSGAGLSVSSGTRDRLSRCSLPSPVKEWFDALPAITESAVDHPWPGLQRPVRSRLVRIPPPALQGWGREVRQGPG